MRNKCKQFDQYAFAAIELSGTKENIKKKCWTAKMNGLRQDSNHIEIEIHIRIRRQKKKIIPKTYRNNKRAQTKMDPRITQQTPTFKH